MNFLVIFFRKIYLNFEMFWLFYGRFCCFLFCLYIENLIVYFWWYYVVFFCLVNEFLEEKKLELKILIKNFYFVFL